MALDIHGFPAYNIKEMSFSLWLGKQYNEVYVVKIRAYIGEATEYDKKETLEERQAQKLAEERQRFCQWQPVAFSCSALRMMTL